MIHLVTRIFVWVGMVLIVRKKFNQGEDSANADFVFY